MVFIFEYIQCIASDITNILSEVNLLLVFYLLYIKQYPNKMSLKLVLLISFAKRSKYIPLQTRIYLDQLY